MLAGVGLYRFLNFTLEIQLKRLIKLLKLALLPLYEVNLTLFEYIQKCFCLERHSERKDQKLYYTVVGVKECTQHNKVAYVVIATMEFMRLLNIPMSASTTGYI